MPTIQTRIKGYTFSLSHPFEPGHQLTAGEAQALNDLRTENIQNNFRGFVNEQISRLAPGQLLPQSTLDALQLQLTTYDQTYRFNEKSTRSRTGDIEREALAVARERTLSSPDTSSLSKEALDDLVKVWAELPAIKEEARLRVSANRSALAGGMDSL